MCVSAEGALAVREALHWRQESPITGSFRISYRPVATPKATWSAMCVHFFYFFLIFNHFARFECIFNRKDAAEQRKRTDRWRTWKSGPAASCKICSTTRTTVTGSVPWSLQYIDGSPHAQKLAAVDQHHWQTSVSGDQLINQSRDVFRPFLRL